jgi:hypothetical protein
VLVAGKTAFLTIRSQAMTQDNTNPNTAKPTAETNEALDTGNTGHDQAPTDRRPCERRGTWRGNSPCGGRFGHGPHGMACRRGGRLRRLIAVFLLVAAGVMIGKAVAHHHQAGPWGHGPAQVTAGQTVPMGKLLDDIGATPEQRQKAESALHK